MFRKILIFLVNSEHSKGLLEDLPRIILILQRSLQQLAQSKLKEGVAEIIGCHSSKCLTVMMALIS